MDNGYLGYVPSQGNSLIASLEMIVLILAAMEACTGMHKYTGQVGALSVLSAFGSTEHGSGFLQHATFSIRALYSGNGSRRCGVGW
jgi:hypothetical protein